MFPSFSVREPSFVLSINGSRALHKLVETCFCAKDKNLFLLKTKSNLDIIPATSTISSLETLQYFSKRGNLAEALLVNHSHANLYPKGTLVGAFSESPDFASLGLQSFSPKGCNS